VLVAEEVDSGKLMVDSAEARLSINYQPTTINSFQQLLRKEKDEASPPACAAWDSLNAFIL